MKIKFIAGLLALTALGSCGGEQKENESTENKDTVAATRDTVAAYEYKYEVAEEDIAPSWWIYIGDSTNNNGLQEFFGKNFKTVYEFAAKNKQPDMPVLAVFTNWSETKNFYTRAGRGVTDSTLKVKGNIKLEKFYTGKALKVKYMGNYGPEMMTAYNDIAHYMEEKGYDINGDSWEVYVTDPGIEKDTTKWETLIYFPVKAK